MLLDVAFFPGLVEPYFHPNIVGNQTCYQLTGLSGIVVGNLYSQNIFGGLMLVLDSNVA